MNRFISWISTHKLATILAAIVAVLLLNPVSPRTPIPLMNTIMKGDIATSMPMVGSEDLLYREEFAPDTSVSDRMVVQNSQMSLKVSDVSDTVNKIISYVESKSGYMVASSVANPEEAATGSVTVRIPEESLNESLEYFRSLSVKVVSENLTGADVTDQYLDIEERLRILEGNKSRFQDIMSNATEISDILNIQRELLSIQNQIDSLKGQQEYLAQTARYAKVTLYLATDELALPYAPEQPWRPRVVFQTAIRSLLTNTQNIGSLIIWLVVYSVIWVPILLVVLYFSRRSRRKSHTPVDMRN